MTLLDADFARDAHPLDVIESVASQREWAFERSGEDEIAIDVGGRLSPYTVSYSWMEDCEALHLACAFDMKVARSRANEVAKLVTLINEQLLMGHFDFWQRENVIMFRQSLILSDAGIAIFFVRPISAVLTVAALAAVLVPVVRAVMAALRRRSAAG